MDTDLVKSFIDLYEQGDPTEGYTEEEALSTFERASEIASPETLRRAAHQSVERLDPKQRIEFGELLQGQGRSEPTMRKSVDGFGIDDLMAGLFGAAGPGANGGQPAVLRQGGMPNPQGPNMAANLGKLLGSPVGRAVIGGIGAFAFKEIMRGHRLI